MGNSLRDPTKTGDNQNFQPVVDPEQLQKVKAKLTTFFAKKKLETTTQKSIESMEWVPKLDTLVIDCCLKSLATEVETVGLFRVPGSTSTVETLFQSFQYPEKLQIKSDAHSISGAFKLYLRSLEPPLIPYHLYDEVMQVSGNWNEDDLSPVIALLNKLPALEYETLEKIINFFYEVAQHSEMNKMDAHNLGIVFGPTLIRSSVPESTSTVLVNTQRTTNLVIRLIENYHKIFTANEGEKSMGSNENSNVTCESRADMLLVESTTTFGSSTLEAIEDGDTTNNREGNLVGDCSDRLDSLEKEFGGQKDLESGGKGPVAIGGGSGETGIGSGEAGVESGVVAPDVEVDVGGVGADVGVDVGSSVRKGFGVDVGRSVGKDLGVDVGSSVGKGVGVDIGSGVDVIGRSSEVDVASSEGDTRTGWGISGNFRISSRNKPSTSGENTDGHRGRSGSFSGKSVVGSWTSTNKTVAGNSRLLWTSAAGTGREGGSGDGYETTRK
eukprot:TRINITY_DN932_c0_g1_i4.p1 TRINITY_DN932_c0_g1~~TRINITY_DN932_c0_g1_i4.p1  ORF type:complete len:497 (-),score=125.24 TRINITY_DN932_c0_g1_i4:102-1592(-)